MAGFLSKMGDDHSSIQVNCFANYKIHHFRLIPRGYGLGNSDSDLEDAPICCILEDLHLFFQYSTVHSVFHHNSVFRDFRNSFLLAFHRDFDNSNSFSNQMPTNYFD